MVSCYRSPEKGAVNVTSWGFLMGQSPYVTSENEGSSVYIFNLMYAPPHGAYIGPHMGILIYRYKMFLTPQVRNLASLI